MTSSPFVVPRPHQSHGTESHGTESHRATSHGATSHGAKAANTDVARPGRHRLPQSSVRPPVAALAGGGLVVVAATRRSVARLRRALTRLVKRRED